MTEWKPGGALPCIVCKKHLDNVHVDNQPYGGLAFNTHGHYGSRIMDPLSDGIDTWLVVNICDDCVESAGKDGHVLVYEKPPTPKAEPRRWDGKY
jgi:hypothetical protein